MAFKNKVGWQFLEFRNIVFWLLLCLLIGSAIGSIAAFFLYLLEVVTKFRTDHLTIIYFLPLAGLLSGLLYHYFGGKIEKGNNLLIEEYHQPSKMISWLMIPFILFTTLLTHLFGGSAGREGTAVQMGGALADQIGARFQISKADRRIILLMGISGGFSSVFGTPFAGALFALELMFLSRVNYVAILPVLLTALLANQVSLGLGVQHSIYPTISFISIDFLTVFKVIVAGIVFGLVAILFIRSTDTIATFFKRYVYYPPLIPFLGGTLFLVVYSIIGDAQFLGLGVPSIEKAFLVQATGTTFLFKLLLTAITLGSAFKGGEVTPLFFIGATLGSFLSLYLGLPFMFLAALGFVGVFSGATKTPMACMFMGMELFGGSNFMYFAIVCIVSYIVSGRDTIYKSQLLFESRKVH